MSDSVSKPPAPWTDVVALADLARGDVTQVAFGKRSVALYDTAEGLFATAGHCSHAGAALVDGYLDGCLIECPLHQGCFDVRDGSPRGAPVTRALATYEVRVVGDRVQIRPRHTG